MELVVEKYKMTEVGLIPDDWKVKPIGKFTDACAGGTPSTKVSAFWNGDIRWMNSGELNFKKVYEVENRITELGLQNSATKFIPENCILVGLAGQGKTRGTVAINKVPLCTNQSIAAIFPCELVDYNYLYFNLDFRYNELRGLSTGDGGRGGLNLNIIKSLPIPIPPTKAEQTAIATALSDADSYISSLEQLIAKKRLLKQGAMQQLLSPKKGWVVKKLGEVAEIYTGKKNNHDKVENGQYPFFVRSQIVERINSYSFDGEAILIPGEGNIGKIFHYINGKFDFHQRVYKISGFTEGCNGKYVYRYLSEYFGRHAMENSVKATVDSLRLPTFQTFEIPFPPTSEEQTRIATILSDMDAGIAALEKQLAKARSIKQGMMQQLLTGRIRLNYDL
jgi:type I restriction enzyme S subunit